MKRREFIAIAGGAVAWPLMARAQQFQQPVIGILDDTGSRWLAAFRQGLKEGEIIEGRDVVIDLRSSEQYAELRPFAEQLVHTRVTMIAALGGVPAKAARSTTATIPIVFAIGGDPVQEGLVPNLNHPGGNITGATFFAAQLLQKQLGILHDLVPKASTIGLLVNPDNPRHQSDVRDVLAAASALGFELHVEKAGTERDLDAAFVDFTKSNAQALLLAGDAFFLVAREKIVALAARHAIPMMYNVRDFVLAGGLVSYGTNVPDVFRQVGIYAARIVKGEKAGDLPVLQPTKFDLTLNVKTAKALGLTVPTSMQLLADEIIE